MERFLVGLDGSPRASLVRDAAIAAARAHHAKLLLLRAVAIPTDIPRDFWKTTDASLLDVVRAHCAAYLDEEAERVPEGMLERADVRIGSPWEALCGAARDERVSLIVIGSHGYSGLDRVLGTTAARIVNHAACSVLVVRDGRARAPKGATGTPSSR